MKNLRKNKPKTRFRGQGSQQIWMTVDSSAEGAFTFYEDIGEGGRDFPNVYTST